MIAPIYHRAAHSGLPYAASTPGNYCAFADCLCKSSGEAGDIFGNLLCLIACKQFCGGPPRRIIGKVDVSNRLSLGVTHNETCGPLFGGPRWWKVTFCHLNLPSTGQQRCKRQTLFWVVKRTAASPTKVHGNYSQKLTHRAARYGNGAVLEMGPCKRYCVRLTSKTPQADDSRWSGW